MTGSRRPYISEPITQPQTQIEPLEPDMVRPSLKGMGREFAQSSKHVDVPAKITVNAMHKAAF